jgi:hypothetical protein
MSMHETGLIDFWRAGNLQWLPELGIGYYPVQEQPYDSKYWQRYREMDNTPVGEQLTTMRIEMVAKHYAGPVVDIGIGGGRFVQDRADTYGYDVNPLACEWLEMQSIFWDVYKVSCRAATFWDSLEHIHRPDILLSNVREWVFVSMPIYRDGNHILRSKHFRKDEHCWYFTTRGLERFMAQLGFRCEDADNREQDAGREDITTFAFRRIT